MQCSMQKLKMKPKLLQCTGPRCKNNEMQGHRMQFYMVKMMHLNELI